MQIKYALAGIAFGGVMLYECFKDKGSAKAPEAGYIFGGILLIMGLYFFRAFILDRPEMTLSRLGIDFLHDGFFS